MGEKWNAKPVSALNQIKRAYPSTILSWVVGSKNCQGWSPANGNLLNEGHKVVRNSTGILTNITTRMCANWIEVS